MPQPPGIGTTRIADALATRDGVVQVYRPPVPYSSTPVRERSVATRTGRTRLPSPDGRGARVVALSATTAASAFTIPAPKNEVCPVPPVHWRGSSAGQFAGHASGVADARSSAATAPWRQSGCS